MDIKLVHGSGPSLIKLYGNISKYLPVKDSGYSFLRSNDFPSLMPSNKRSRSAEKIVQDCKTQCMVLIVYQRIQKGSQLMRERYKNLFTKSRFDTD